MDISGYIPKPRPRCEGALALRRRQKSIKQIKFPDRENPLTVSQTSTQTNPTAPKSSEIRNDGNDQNCHCRLHRQNGPSYYQLAPKIPPQCRYPRHLSQHREGRHHNQKQSTCQALPSCLHRHSRSSGRAQEHFCLHLLLSRREHPYD